MSSLINKVQPTLFSRLAKFQTPDSFILVLTAIVVGGGTGLGAVIFIKMLSALTKLHHNLIALGPPSFAVPILLLTMGIAGLIVGYMVDHWAKEAKGHGVPEVMEAIALRGGRIRPRVALIKVLASSITIGFGGSAGREGPIVQVGSALGSTLGQVLHLSGERIRTLVACGAAAGIAATFNAPIAGAIFALEVVLGRFTTRYFGAVVISAVSASIIGRIFLGSQPAFAVPAYPLTNFAELPIYIVLGCLSAIVAVVFVRLLYRMEDLFDNWRLSATFKASIGLILTGITASVMSERLVLGPGLDFIGEAIADDFSVPLTVMMLLLVLKLFATCFTLGSGNSGGVFAPSLFMGAIVGGLVGNVSQTLFPGVVGHPGAFAIVGMAAVFAAAARAPITGILIVFEMSNDYQLILPLMMATVLSTLVAELLFSESIYTLKLRLKGISLQRGRDRDVMQNLSVQDAMERNPYVVEKNMPLDALLRFFQKAHSHSFPIVDDKHHLVGMVTMSDYERYSENGELGSKTVSDIANIGDILLAYEDEPLGDVLQRIALRDVSKLPVVSRRDPKKVVGVIRRRDIVKAYNLALSRRAVPDADSTDNNHQSWKATENTEFLEVRIKDDSFAADKSLIDLSKRLPHDCVIVFVRRHGTVLIP
ncbi:MAG: chloride channel protein, partial [Candidatus Promineifilaceae bacterium]